MRRPSVLLLIFLLAAAAPALLAAETGDPSDMFLNAYLDVQAGEKFEADENYRMALAKYRHAFTLLDKISKDSPDWQPLIVAYRTKKTEESITQLQQKVGIEAEPPRAPSGLVPDTETPLPEKGPDTEPTAENTPGAETTAAGGDPLDQVRKRIKHLEQDLEAEHQRADDAEKQNDVIAQHLQAALKERDASKVQAVEEKSRVRELEDALKTALQDTSRNFTGKKKLDDEIAHLNAELIETRDERDEEREGKADETDRAAAARKRLAGVQQERDAAVQKNQEAEGKLAEAQKQVEALTKEQGAGGAANADLTAKLSAATKQVAELTRERDSAVAASDDLTVKLTHAQTELASVTRERDSFRVERDKALADLSKLKQAQKQVAKLVADNASLTDRLGEAEKAVAEFKADAPEEGRADRDPHQADRRRPGSTRGEPKAEPGFPRHAWPSFRISWTDTSSELERVKAEGANPEERKRLTSENQVLRDIVYRSLKEEARREQSRSIVMGEMAKLENQSGALMEKLKYLAEPVVKLTPQEAALFKQPDIAPAENSMNIEISAPKNSQTAAAPSPASSPYPAPGPAPGEPDTNPLPSPASLALAPSPSASGAPQAPHVETASTPNVPDSVRPLVKEAKDLYDRTKYHDAERSYERALLRAPNNVFILSNLGVVRFKLGKLKGSEEAFKKAITIDSNDTFSRTTLGIVYYQEARYDDAIDQLTKALSINPKIPQAHNYLGITASMKGWPEATEKELLTAISLDDNYADANFNLAVVYATRQPPDKDKAKKYYKRAVELGSEPDPAMEQLLK